VAFLSDTLDLVAWTSFAPASQQAIDSLLAKGVAPIALWSVLGQSDDTDSIPVLGSLVKAHKRANSQPLRLHSPPQLVGLEVTLQDTGTSSWRHPIVFLTRPGFGALGDSALIQIFEACGGTCGEGTTVLLVKQRGRWRVVETFGAVFSWAFAT
jgi:hypothetical protein